MGGVGADLRVTQSVPSNPHHPHLPVFSNHTWVSAPHHLSSSAFSARTHPPRSSSDYPFSSPWPETTSPFLSAFGSLSYLVSKYL